MPDTPFFLLGCLVDIGSENFPQWILGIICFILAILSDPVRSTSEGPFLAHATNTLFNGAWQPANRQTVGSIGSRIFNLQPPQKIKRVCYTVDGRNPKQPPFPRMKPCKYWGYLPYQLVQSFFPSTICPRFHTTTSGWKTHHFKALKGEGLTTHPGRDPEPRKPQQLTPRIRKFQGVRLLKLYVFFWKIPPFLANKFSPWQFFVTFLWLSDLQQSGDQVGSRRLNHVGWIFLSSVRTSKTSTDIKIPGSPCKFIILHCSLVSEFHGLLPKSQKEVNHLFRDKGWYGNDFQGNTAPNGLVYDWPSDWRSFWVWIYMLQDGAPLTTICRFLPSYTHLQPWLNMACWGYSYLITRGPLLVSTSQPRPSTLFTFGVSSSQYSSISDTEKAPRYLRHNSSKPGWQATDRVFFFGGFFPGTPPKTNIPLKNDYFSRECIFQPLIFRGHVSFQGNIFLGTNICRF